MRVARPVTEVDLEEIRDTFADPDVSLIKGIYYFEGWTDWEEYGGVLIFQGIDDSIQCVEYGYSVMAEDNTNYFSPEEITAEEMEARIEIVEGL